MELIQARDWDGAKRQVDHMLADEVGSMYGFAVMQMTLAETYEGNGERFDALVAARRATMSAISIPDPQKPPSSANAFFLPQPSLSSALRRRMRLEVGLGYYADALDTIAQIAALAAPAGDDPIVQVEHDLREALRSKGELEAEGRIDRDSGWGFKANRSRFAISRIDEGSIETIELRCREGRRSLQVQPDVEWRVPESWGPCRIEFKGTRGTRFKVRFFGEPEPPA